MSGPRRDSADGTRGGPEHGSGGKSTDDNKKHQAGAGQGHRDGRDSNAHAAGGGVGSSGTPGTS